MGGLSTYHFPTKLTLLQVYFFNEGFDISILIPDFKLIINNAPAFVQMFHAFCRVFIADCWPSQTTLKYF